MITLIPQSNYKLKPSQTNSSMPQPKHSSSPFHKLENTALLSLLQRTTNVDRKSKPGGGSGGGGGLFRMFKLLPMLTTGCKMVALLGNKTRRHLLTDKATIITFFGNRRGRINLAINEDPHRLPIFVIELPILTSTFHKEIIASDVMRLAFESETKTHKKKIFEEFAWVVFCNGKKMGYSIRRTSLNDDESHIMQLLRGVSMGAGVVSSPTGLETETPRTSSSGGATMSLTTTTKSRDVMDNIGGVEGEMTYMRARFQRAVGSKDSESFYMINPDGASAQELSIFFVRSR